MALSGLCCVFFIVTEEIMARASQPQRLGEGGYDLICDTSNHAGTWHAIQILENAIFSTLTDATQSVSGGTLGSFQFPAGTLISGAFTSITLSNGAILAYNT